MPMQAPKAVTFEGRGGSQTAQAVAYALKKAAVASVSATTGATALPLSSNGLAYALYLATVIGTDPVYFALGTSGITVDHTTDNCDGVLLGNTQLIIAIPSDTITHIAMITESGTPTVVISPCV